jgi:hypothetical protein
MTESAIAGVAAELKWARIPARADSDIPDTGMSSSSRKHPTARYPFSEQTSDTLPIDLNSLGIGRHVSGIAAPFNGHTDEFRIAHVQRSDGWIETTWNDLSDPGAFAVGRERRARTAASRHRFQAPMWSLVCSGENTRRGRPTFCQATVLAKIAGTPCAVLRQSIMPADPRQLEMRAVEEATP